MKNYTHKPIETTEFKYIMPEKWGLVLEGGGTRGCFTAGVLDSFLQEGLGFPYVVGVSAGAANALSFLSGQFGRNKQMTEYYICNKKYMSVRNFCYTKSYLNRSYIFYDVPEKHVFFHWNAFASNPCHFLAGAFDCNNGRTIWFEKQEMTSEFQQIMASTAVPYVSPMVELGGKSLLDGGLLHGIPIEKSVEDGNEFHVIVLTQSKHYRKKKYPSQLADIYYKKYPKLVEVLKNRYKIYNAQLDLCENLVKNKKAVVIQPSAPVTLGRMEQNIEKLLQLYEDGRKSGDKSLQLLKQHIPYPESTAVTAPSQKKIF